MRRRAWLSWWPSAGLMLFQRLRRWTNNKPTLGDLLWVVDHLCASHHIKLRERMPGLFGYIESTVCSHNMASLISMLSGDACPYFGICSTICMFVLGCQITGRILMFAPLRYEGCESWDLPIIGSVVSVLCQRLLAPSSHVDPPAPLLLVAAHLFSQNIALLPGLHH